MVEKRTVSGQAGYIGERGTCPVCKLDDHLTRHHLRPKQQVGSDIDHSNNILKLCHVCHKFLHKTFTNEVLESQLFSLEMILANQQVDQHIKLRKRKVKE